ncbi:hypothetical protein QOZ80_6AG0528480 [Eleusine coracana subsp. coracana]|nr:hypothetical protein QOZ80_6AG0528480 [Eleusine coracana subsp. coracana]
MAPSSSPCLNADAPLFVPQAPHVLPRPAAPMVVSYMPQPMGLSRPFMGPPPPPPRFASPFMGPPLPPAPFACPVQGMIPPPGFSSPFPGPPPPCGFPVPSRPIWGIPPRSAAGLPPMMRMPLDIIARPAAPAAAQPLVPAVEDGDKPRPASGRGPKRPRKQQRAAAKRAAALGPVAIGEGGHAAAMGDEPSPRSVLVAAAPSPPGTPPVLPASFPYPAPTGSSLPASAGHDVAAQPPRPTGSQRFQPLASGHGSRRGRGSQRPRRRFDASSGMTTMMIRNIPNGFTRQKVMNIIDQHCAEENAKIAVGDGVRSAYDFIYVPFDFRTQANLGYCFVNVTSTEAASRLYTHLHGYRWKVRDSRKMCEVDYADIQGREALVEHFSGSCFHCDTEEFLPVWFSPPRDGTRPAVVNRHVVGRLGRRV